MDIGSLRQRAEILRLADERDSYGAVTGQWRLLRKVWADIQVKTGEEFMSDKKVKAQTSADITIRYIPGITSKDRIC